MDFKAGFINIIGRPNVGKSTLMNAMLGEKLSIVTPKAQTTRHRIKGILTDAHHQLVFSDSPGIVLDPASKLHESMLEAIETTFEDADVMVVLTEPGEPREQLEWALKRLEQLDVPKILVINKVDKGDQQAIQALIDEWKATGLFTDVVPASALHGFNVQELLALIKSYLPEHPAYFDEDQLTDKTERFVVAEMIREQILMHYKKEIPYAVEVEVDKFKEAENIVRIWATIYVERDTQKSIIIGKGGKAIKRLGIAARKEIETFLGKQVYLELFVKVSEQWRSKSAQLKRFGYKH